MTQITGTGFLKNTGWTKTNHGQADANKQLKGVKIVIRYMTGFRCLNFSTNHLFVLSKLSTKY